MKKKLVGLMVAGIAVFALSGCGSGGGDDGYVPPPPSNLTTLFLVDQNGMTYGGIPYRCDSMRDWEVVAPNGAFSFSSPDSCEFDFTVLRGNLFGDPFVDDIVRIVDVSYGGLGGIPYDCSSFGASSTYGDGSFNYDIGDQCVFYL